jgi:phytoene dehydrogenase-like protein
MAGFKNANVAGPSVIVVGAGAGGVALAARLAAAGCKVTVVEKNDSPGGRCNLIHRQGYVWLTNSHHVRRVYLLEERLSLIKNTEI